MVASPGTRGAVFFLACDDALVPVYQIRCPLHGVHDVIRPIERFDDLWCEAAPPRNALRPSSPRQRCFAPVDHHFTADMLARGLIDAGGEDATEISARVADGTARYNVGLPGVDTVVGTRPNGKAALEYRPITHHELGSNAGVREYAKRHNLEPVESTGRFRSVP